MPGDLRDPEQFQTFHYDPRYDATPNQFLNPGEFNMNAYLQSIAMDTFGKQVDQKLISLIKDKLLQEGYLHQNPGDENFRSKVKDLLMARKVASKWLI
jgi:hypothetical protein